MTELRKDIAKAIEKLEENNLDTSMINISINTDLSLSGWLGVDEPGDYVNKYSVEIELYLDEDFETKKTIGQFTCLYFSGFDWANDKFIDLVDTADSISGDVLTAITPVTNNNGQVLDDYMGCNILYIDEFYLRPEYRDKGIGTMVFPLIIDVLGRDAGVVTIIPTPTENDGNKRIDTMDPSYKPTYNKMCKFIMKYGFFCIDRENRVWAKDSTLAD